MVEFIAVQQRYAHGQEQLVAAVDLWFRDDGGVLTETDPITHWYPRALDAGQLPDVADAVQVVLAEHIPAPWHPERGQVVTATAYKVASTRDPVIHVTGEVVHTVDLNQGTEWARVAHLSIAAG